MQEILMLTCIIDEMEGRDTAVAKIPGAFLQTDMVHIDRIVRVRICGVLADLLVKIDSAKFTDKVVLEGLQKVIYAALKKSLCGALISSLILWWDLSDAQASWGF